MNERKDVYKLPAGDTTLEWYAKAVLEMKKRPTTDPTSWNYQAAMHGFNAALPAWQGAPPLPSVAERNQFWNQCQHGSWYFLPWHRMYLAYFEQIVAQTIVDIGGPAGWMLPFWNYSDTSNPQARTMPDAFTNPANASNGLWLAARASDVIPARYVTLGALNTIPYTGDGRTSPLGFGGPETTFSHSGQTHGQLESLPHDMVHVSIGGDMGDPRTAALDPIFWLHHANIDRLWQVWLNMGSRFNPAKSSWLNFKFEFHDKDGKAVEMTCSDVEDTTKILGGYVYQGVPPGVPTQASKRSFAMSIFEGTNDFSRPFDVVAATNTTLALNGGKAAVKLALAAAPRRSMKFAAMEAATDTAVTTTLHFENITGKGVPPIHDVYLNAPDGAGDKESYYAGSVSFFGVEEASTPSVHQSGSGQHYALDITDLMKQLRSRPNWNDQELDVSLEPSREMGADTAVSIGRISLYSE